MGKTPAKSRFFDFIVYPESAPDDWQKRLKDTHACFAISPAHQPDEEEKKLHYHCIYYTGNGPITLQAARGKLVPLEVAANGHIEITLSPSGYQRYLIHLDDPEKEQFPGGEDCITVLNGFPLDLTRELTKGEKAQVRAQIINIIRDKDVREYSTLVYGLMDMGAAPEVIDFACQHTLFFNALITSQRHAEKEAKRAEFEAKAEARKAAEAADAKRFTEVGGGAIDFEPHEQDCTTVKEDNDA